MASHMQYKIGERAEARLRKVEPGDEKLPLALITVESTRTCKHVETICGNCIEQWRQDWAIKNP